MSTTNASFIASDDALSLPEKIGTGLMWLAVLGAVGAAGAALLTVLDAGGATKVVEHGACMGWSSSSACSRC